MLTRVTKLVFVCPLLLLIVFAAPAFPKGSDVEFHGTVVRVNLGSGADSVTVHIVGFDVPVKVNADTEVESHGDENELSDIEVGDFVKISAFFTDSGITAREIQIFDNGAAEFRLRGLLSAVRSTTSGRIVTILGVDVLVDSATKLERRGPGGEITANDLAVNLFADASGVERNGQLVATKLKVGNREDQAIRLNFSGKITSVVPGRLTVETNPGVAVVLINSATVVTGVPAVGKFAEVHGTLNSNLEVMAARVDIKTKIDDDGTPPPMPSKFDKKIAIKPVGAVSSVKGDAHVKLEQKPGESKQQIEVHLQQGQPNAVYTVRITIAGSPISLGTVTTNAKGDGQLKLEGASLTSLLPAGKTTVRDITKIEILASGSIVAQGTFD